MLRGCHTLHTCIGCIKTRRWRSFMQGANNALPGNNIQCWFDNEYAEDGTMNKHSYYLLPNHA